MSRSNETRAPDPGPREQDSHHTRIRDLNDRFRQRFAGGQILITPGVQELASDHFAMTLRRVATFIDFSEDNDRHGEHDFGAVEIAGIKVFWKIDYYDLGMTAGSPDPADPSVTTRVLTIMLASEY